MFLNLLNFVFFLLNCLGLMLETLVASSLFGRERQTHKQRETTEADKTTEFLIILYIEYNKPIH